MTAKISKSINYLMYGIAFERHDKVLLLCEELDLDLTLVCGLFVRMWSRVVELSPGGWLDERQFRSAVVAPVLGGHLKMTAKELVAALEDAGFIDRAEADENMVRFHNWDTHQDYHVGRERRSKCSSLAAIMKHKKDGKEARSRYGKGATRTATRSAPEVRQRCGRGANPVSKEGMNKDILPKGNISFSGSDKNSSADGRPIFASADLVAESPKNGSRKDDSATPNDQPSPPGPANPPPPQTTRPARFADRGRYPEATGVFPDASAPDGYVRLQPIVERAHALLGRGSDRFTTTEIGTLRELTMAGMRRETLERVVDLRKVRGQPVRGVRVFQLREQIIEVLEEQNAATAAG